MVALLRSLLERTSPPFRCLTNAGKDPNAFSEGLINLALYHYRDIHKWDGGHCDFHPLVVCSCGSCTDEYNLKCEGTPYKRGHILNCPFHSLAYELECREKAALADVLIHPEIGKVTTNIVEASHNVLVRYRSKNFNVARLHYQVSTNLGLIQSCMTNFYTKRGPEYHWIVDLLNRMDLPVVPNLPYILKELNEKRFSYLQSKKSDAAKAKRKLYKKRRKVHEHQRRRLFVQKSAMKLKYGSDEEDTPIRKCKCGSTDHKRTIHKSCPLNNNAFEDIDPATEDDVSSVSEPDSEPLDYDDVESEDESCSCPNYPRHRWDCPDNVRNRKRASATPSRTLWTRRASPQVNKKQSTTSVNVSTLQTPPLKKMNLSLIKCPSPLIVSQQSTPACKHNDSTAKKVDFQSCACPNYPCHNWDCHENVRNRKRANDESSCTPQVNRKRSTTAVDVTPSGTLQTPPLKKMNLSLIKCPSPLIVSQQSTPAGKHNDSTAKKVDFQSCACPNYPCHNWDCHENVRNRKRANDEPSGTPQVNKKQCTTAVDVTPSFTLWTIIPPKKVDHPSPLNVSQVKEQSTPAVKSTVDSPAC